MSQIDEIEKYREMWLKKVEELGIAQCKFEEAKLIITELYYSSFWDSDRLLDETAGLMWTRVKQIFELTEPGPARININDPKVGD